MQLILVSGLSGAGKSIALDVLEDGGYYCVDNLPATLLEDVVRFLEQGRRQVVDAVVAAVLQHIERDALARAGQTADENELQPIPSGTRS